MPAPIPENLQKKVAEWLAFYQDLGIAPFYRDRPAETAFREEQPAQSPESTIRSAQIPHEEPTLPKTLRKPDLQKLALALPKIAPLPTAPAPSLFDSADKVALVFVGEGPGADEDAQGLPFVGRAGKLLTQMIEAMGLQRKDVYICNVVKCRPPENRTPEEDEVSACSPFLLRQLDVISPKVIVCLGAVAAKTLLKTNRGISQFRGQWLDFRSSKLMATYHPAYLLRNPNAKGEVWKDLQKVMAVLGLQPKKGKPV